MKQLSVFLGLLMFACLSWGAAPTQAEEPLIVFNLGVELDGVESAIQGTNHSLGEMVEALHLIASNQSLDQQQSEELSNIINNINQLTASSARTMAVLPEAVTSARRSIISNSVIFYDELKSTVLIIIALLVLAVVVLIVCLYWFIVRPMQCTIVNTTANIAQMTETIQSMASSIEKSGDNHIKILQQLPKGEYPRDSYKSQ